LVSSSAYAQLRPLPDVRTTTESTNDFIAYTINTTRPILRDVRVRRAISMAIDRKTIADKNTFGTGTPAYADLPALLWTSHEPVNPYGYNPTAASALLDAAGWKRGPAGIREKNGVPLQLQAIDFTGKTNQNIDTQTTQMLQDIGIGFSVKYYSTSIYYQSKADGGPFASGNFDVAVMEWQGGIDAQDDLIYTCANRQPEGENAALYCSAQMDALQHDALVAGALDPARRATDIAKIEALAVSDVPYVFLYHTPFRIAYNPLLNRTHANIADVWYDSRKWSFANQ
jgi:peptide/nickel transport system substrate-binding protein